MKIQETTTKVNIITGKDLSECESLVRQYEEFDKKHNHYIAGLYAILPETEDDNNYIFLVTPHPIRDDIEPYTFSTIDQLCNHFNFPVEDILPGSDSYPFLINYNGWQIDKVIM